MGPSDIEVIRDQYAAVNERDWERAMGHYTEDVELVVRSGINSGTFRGRDAVGGWFGDWFSTFAHDAHFEITEATELDDGSVFIVADHHVTGRASGIGLEDKVHWRYKFRDRKITYVQGFSSREDALGPNQ